MSQPSPAGARGWASGAAGRTGLVGVLVPLIDDLYFSGILAGVAEAVYEQEMRLVVCPTLNEHAREVSLLDRLKHQTDGAVLVLPEESSAELERALSDRYPVVVVDTLMALDESIPTVTAAHASGADQAMRHLLALGHRRIAAITGPPGWVATEERRRGYQEALAASGIRYDPSLLIEADFETGPGAEAARQLLELPEPPTAIFAFNDAIAIGVMHAAREWGLRVPDDVSVVGFDDLRYATVVSPALTTVRQPLRDMGRAAVSQLLRILDGHLETRRIELPTRLVIRESAGPLARAGAPRPGALGSGVGRPPAE